MTRRHNPIPRFLPQEATISTLARIRSGDSAALDELLSAHWAPLVAYVRPLVGEPDAAEDAVQEAFVRLWERRERWKPGSARALLYRMARNAALDAARRRKSRERSADELTRRAREPERPDELLTHERLQERARAAVASLPAKRREVFELIRYHGLGHAEVAEVLGRSPQTVANHMSLALQDLRVLLADLLPRPEARHADEGAERPSDG